MTPKASASNKRQHMNFIILSLVVDFLQVTVDILEYEENKIMEINDIQIFIFTYFYT